MPMLAFAAIPKFTSRLFNYFGTHNHLNSQYFLDGFLVLFLLLFSKIVLVWEEIYLNMMLEALLGDRGSYSFLCAK